MGGGRCRAADDALPGELSAQAVDGVAGRRRHVHRSALDIFGCDSARPLDRLDRAGLLLLLHMGEEIIAITGTAATIRTSSGALQRYYRKPCNGAVCVWELAS
jgi:hypothetical protein